MLDGKMSEHDRLEETLLRLLILERRENLEAELEKLIKGIREDGIEEYGPLSKWNAETLDDFIANVILVTATMLERAVNAEGKGNGK